MVGIQESWGVMEYPALADDLASTTIAKYHAESKAQKAVACEKLGGMIWRMARRNQMHSDILRRMVVQRLRENHAEFIAIKDLPEYNKLVKTAMGEVRKAVNRYK